MNLVPWRRDRRNDDDIWAPFFPISRGLLEEFFDWPRTALERQARFSPPLNVAEDENGYKIAVELPGVDPGAVELTVEGNTLTLRGEKKEENEKKDKNYHIVERRYGSFSRSLTLPADVQADKVEANYRNGVLEISLPKSESAKPKAIPVKVAK